MTVIVCNTFYQLIVSLRLRETILADDSVHLIITDQTKGFDKISEKIQNMGLFDVVSFVRTKELITQKTTKLKKISILSKMCVGDQEIVNMIKEKINKLFFYNDDTFTYILYASLSKKNRELNCYMFEEGILSYNFPFNLNFKKKTCNIVRKLIRKPIFLSNVCSLYCFYPKLYLGDMETFQIPLITKNSNLFDILYQLFDMKDRTLNYSYKYIYFSGIYDMEGGKSIGELSLCLKIAEKVGKENMLVKVHPRDSKDRFLKEGLLVDDNSDIPWEVIQINYDFKETVFLSCLSGSVMLVNMLTDHPQKTFYLSRLADYTDNNMALNQKNNIENAIIRITADGKNEWLKIADSLEDVL